MLPTGRVELAVRTQLTHQGLCGKRPTKRLRLCHATVVRLLLRLSCTGKSYMIKQMYRHDMDVVGPFRALNAVYPAGQFAYFTTHRALIAFTFLELLIPCTATSLASLTFARWLPCVTTRLSTAWCWSVSVTLCRTSLPGTWLVRGRPHPIL